MTREERDKKEAEKKARMEGSPDIGGVTLPFSRNTLLKVFWVFAVVYPIHTLWSARQDLSFELFFSGMVLYVACMLPGWFWCTGRIQGLPIFPLFAISFLPKYVVPLWQGHSTLDKYTPNEINTAAWTVAGFLLVGALFWQQSAVRKVGIPGRVRMIDIKKAEKVLLWCIFAQVLFEILSLILWQLGGGGFAAVRGFATAAGRMGIFVFAYQMGLGQLSKAKMTVFLVLFFIVVIEETASLVLATVLPTLGTAFAAYMLGSGKIPWKALAGMVVAMAVLHAGKFEMREKYIYSENPRMATFQEYPAYFAEWVEYGLINLGRGKPGQEKKEVSSVAERGSLLHMMVMIQTMTPSKVPYLEGETYKFIPSLLIPRILSPNKRWAHTGNMMLSMHYGMLDQEGIFRTSIAFDPVMEAYANYGYVGVLVAAIITGFFLGWVTKLTIHVPMLSFGFMFGVLVIGTTISAWNTTGVFVTSTWQAFLALCGLSMVLMIKQNNPVWKYYALKLAEKLKFKKDAKLKRKLEEVERVLEEKGLRDSGVKGVSESEVVAGSVSTEDGGQRAVVAGQGSVVSGHPSTISENPSTVQQKHERPTRFVYGEKKK